MPKIGVMICAHGSRSQAAVDEFAVLAKKLPDLLPSEWPVEYGYLEFANPVIRDGLDRLRAQGCTRILADNEVIMTLNDARVSELAKALGNTRLAAAVNSLAQSLLGESI